MAHTQLELFIRLPEVRQRVGISKSQIYKRRADEQGKQPVKVSQRISCWAAAEVEEWVRNKIQERDEELLL